MQRLGVIVPSSNTSVEVEFARALYGSEVSLHFSRIRLNDVTVKALQDMEDGTQAAAELLRDAGVDVVVFACTSGSLIRGIGYDQLIAQKIAKAADCPAVTTSGAVVEALKALGARKISLATPYIKEVTDREVGFLEKSGFEVVRVQSLGIRENLKIGKLTPHDAAALAKNAYSADAQALFISCTNFRTFEGVAALESQLGKPMVSSNTATLWVALRVLQALADLPLGRLFSNKQVLNAPSLVHKAPI